MATADAAYGAIAAFGLTAVTEILVGIDRPLGIVGGAILVGLAVRAFRAATSGPTVEARDDARRPGGHLPAFASMLGLTLTNPATILSFAALFASIGAGTGGPMGAAIVVAGVFTGSIAWWALLTGIVARLRTRLTAGIVRGLNIVSALVIGVFGIAAMAIGLAR